MSKAAVLILILYHSFNGDEKETKMQHTFMINCSVPLLVQTIDHLASIYSFLVSIDLNWVKVSNLFNLQRVCEMESLEKSIK